MKKLALFFIILICSNNLFANEIRNILKKDWSEIYQQKLRINCDVLLPVKERSMPYNSEADFSYRGNDDYFAIEFRNHIYEIKEITAQYLLAGNTDGYHLKISNKNSLDDYVVDLKNEKIIFYCSKRY